MKLTQGFREIDHTADWELEVWAPDLTALLVQAAEGMFHLAGLQVNPSSGRQITFTLPFLEPEQLLVAFLNELLFRSVFTGSGLVDLSVRIDQDRLHAHATAFPLKSVDKEIKAATYHDLKIHQDRNGFHTRIVFDV